MDDDTILAEVMAAFQSGSIVTVERILMRYPAALHATILDQIEELLYIQSEMALGDAPPDMLAVVDAAWRKVVDSIPNTQADPQPESNQGQEQHHDVGDVFGVE